jgi:hypothetical protein
MTFHGHSIKTNLRFRTIVFLGGLGASDVFVLTIVETLLQCLGGRCGLVFSATRPVGDLSRAALMYISDWVRYADISCYEYAIVDGWMVAGGFSPINCRSIHSGVHGRP